MAVSGYEGAGKTGWKQPCSLDSLGQSPDFGFDAVSLGFQLWAAHPREHPFSTSKP